MTHDMILEVTEDGATRGPIGSFFYEVSPPRLKVKLPSSHFGYIPLDRVIWDNNRTKPTIEGPVSFGPEDAPIWKGYIKNGQLISE